MEKLQGDLNQSLLRVALSIIFGVSGQTFEMAHEEIFKVVKNCQKANNFLSR